MVKTVRLHQRKNLSLIAYSINDWLDQKLKRRRILIKYPPFYCADSSYYFYFALKKMTRNYSVG